MIAPAQSEPMPDSAAHDSLYRHDVTGVLAKLEDGDSNVANELLPLVYEELRTLAARSFLSQPGDHTLQPTALVHEAYIHLVNGRRQEWKDRAHFFTVAAMAMRQILINHAHARQAAKRGGGKKRVPLCAGLDGTEVKDEFILALDDALKKLTAVDPSRARIVELRFFGGLTVKETAEVLGVPPRSVDRGWSFAKSWLHREITKGD